MEKILAIHMDEKKLSSIYKVCSQMKVAVICVQEQEMDDTLEHLLENKFYKGTTVGGVAGQQEEQRKEQGNGESMIVMCELSEKHVDKLLAHLRTNNINIDYKAVLTPTNKSWNVRKMLFQMSMEKRAYEQKGN